MRSSPAPGPARAAPSRLARYLQRAELRGNLLGTVGRRCYFEAIRRVAPGQLGRSHVARLRGTTFSIEAPLSEPVGRSLFLYGIYEPLATAVFASLLRDGDTAVDVGAHYGDFTLMASFMVGTGGRVLAFEPQVAMRRILERNLTRNAITNVDVMHQALSDFQGTAPLFNSTDPHQTGGASLSAGQVGQDHEYVVTAVERLDNLIPDRDVDLLAAMKIDVEGEEAGVLLGSSTTLARSGAALVLEVNDLREGNDGFNCPAFEVLHDLGYSVFGMVDSPAGFMLQRIPPGADPRPYNEPWLALNVVALRAGSRAEERLRSTGRFA